MRKAPVPAIAGRVMCHSRSCVRVHLSIPSPRALRALERAQDVKEERLARRELAHVWRGCVGESGSQSEERAEGEEGSREPSKLGSRAVQKQERSRWVNRFLLATHNFHHPLSTTP